MSEVRILSATHVDTHRSCSLKWHYRYVERAPEEQKSGALVVGSVVDVAVKGIVQVVHAGEAKPDDLDPVRLVLQAWDAELSALGPVPVAWDAKGPERALETATGLVRAYLALPDLPERVARVVGVDVPFDLEVVDPDTGKPVTSVRVRGVLDFVERRPESDGRLRALDLKTAANRGGYDPVDLAVHLQAGIYGWALRQTHGDRAADEVAFTVGLKLKDPLWEDRSVSVGAAAQRRALLTVLHVARAMDLGIAHP